MLILLFLAELSLTLLLRLPLFLFLLLHLRKILLLPNLPLLTLLTSDILVQSVAVLRDTELLVIVDHDLDNVVASDLLFLASELSNVGMRQSLLNGQPLVRVEDQ